MRHTRLLVLGLALAFAPCPRAQEPPKTQESSQPEEKKPAIGWNIANFAILIGFIAYMVRKHGGDFFVKRTAQIQAALNEAAQAKQESEQRVAEMERRIAGLSAEIERMRAEVRSEMAAEGERIRLETERHIRRIEEEATQEIETMIKVARRELKMYSAELAIKLAEEQLAGRVTKDVENNLVSSFIADLRTRNGGNNYN